MGVAVVNAIRYLMEKKQEQYTDRFPHIIKKNVLLNIFPHHKRNFFFPLQLKNWEILDKTKYKQRGDMVLRFFSLGSLSPTRLKIAPRLKVNIKNNNEK